MIKVKLLNELKLKNSETLQFISIFLLIYIYFSINLLFLSQKKLLASNNLVLYLLH